MNKILRYSMMLLLFVCGMNAHADEIDFSTLSLTNGTQYADPFDGGSFTVTFAGGANDGKYYDTGTGIRVYGNGTMTIAAKSGSISQIVVTYHNATASDQKTYPETDDIVSTGTYTAGEATGTWTGEASEVVFARPSGKGHWRVQKIEVTIGTGDPGQLSAPTISGETSFEETTTVTITTTETGATILYTTNGDDPTEAGLTYTAPFTLDATATVKACVTKDNKFSAVASKTFTKVELSGVSTIAAFNALANGTENVVLTLTNAKVLAIGYTNEGGQNAYVINDGTAGTELYGITLEANQGDLFNGTVTGKRVDYRGITEMSPITDNSITVTTGTANPTVATVAEIKDAEIFGALYKLVNVEVIKDGNNFYIKDGENQIQIYNSLKTPGITLAAGQYNIEGVVGAYNANKQFLPTKFETYVEPSDVPAPTIIGSESFEESTTVTITTEVEDGIIYYTTDGTDPKTSANRQEYENPFNITETTTVMACVEDGLGTLSSTVSKTFTKVASGNAANIAAFNALPDDTENVVLTLTNAQVLAKGGKYTIVADATAGTEFYNVSDPALNVGDILNGTITGKKTSYKKVPELTNVTANTLTITEGTATPTVAELSVVAAAPIFATLYKIENVAVSAVNGKNATMTVGETTMALYNQLGTVTLAEGNYDIEGVVGLYEDNVQFWPTKMEKNLGDKQDPALAFPEASYNVTLGEEFTEPVLTNEFNVTVVYSSTNEDVATVNASTGEVTILTAGSTTIKATFEENDEYVGSIASYTLVVTDPSWTTKGTFENPFEVADLTAMDPNNIIVEGEVWVKGYIIGSCKSSGALEDTPETATNIAIAATVTDTENYAPVQLPADSDVNGNIRSTLNVVDNADNIGKEVMVKGKIEKYMSRVGVKSAAAYEIDGNLVGIDNIKADAAIDANAPAYNLAGQRVSKNYRGVVIINGKRVVIK